MHERDNILMEIATFILSAVTSAIIDLSLFSLFCKIFVSEDVATYIMLSSILARIISATYNFFINYTFVFKSNEKIPKAVGKYIMLAMIQMILSTGLTVYWFEKFSYLPEVTVKIVVDGCIFVTNFIVQKYMIFRKKRD